jgi:hypothetical protein
MSRPDSTSWAIISLACGVSKVVATVRASSSSADTACSIPISRSASRTEAELTRAVIGRSGACLRNITALISTSPSLAPVTRACWAPSGLADLTVAGSVGSPRTTCTSRRTRPGSTSAASTTGTPAASSSSRIAGTVGLIPTMSR